MRDPEDDDDDTRTHRDDRLFGTGGFRRRLSEGLTGLLDPDGALGKGKDYVTGVTNATKTEVVRMISAEVRNFLDGMDTVELMQRVIAGLVVDVKAEIRFSVDPQGQLKTNISNKESEVRSVDDPPRQSAPPPTPSPTMRPSEPRHEPRQESRPFEATKPPTEAKKPAEPPRVEVKPKPDKPPQ